MQIITRGYVNHIGGSSFDGAGNLYFLATQAGPGAGDDVAVVKKRTPAGVISDVHVFRELLEGKPGYGSVAPAPNGDLICLLSLRAPSGEQVGAIEILPGLATPWAYGGAAGTADALVRTILRAVRTALGPLG